VVLNDINLVNELKQCNIADDKHLDGSTIISEEKIKLANSSVKSQLKSINSLNNINDFRNENIYTKKFQTISEGSIMLKNNIKSINDLPQNNLKASCLLYNSNSNINSINKNDLIPNKITNLYPNNIKLNNFSSNHTNNHTIENNPNSINYKNNTIESNSPYYELSENKIKLNSYLNNNGMLINSSKNNMKFQNRLRKKIQNQNYILGNTNKKLVILKHHVPFKRKKDIDINYKNQFNANRISSSTQQRKVFISSNDIKYRTPFAKKTIDKANFVNTPQESYNYTKNNYENLLDYKNIKSIVINRNIKKGINKNNNKNKVNINLINNNNIIRKENSIKNIDSIYYYNKRYNFVKNTSNMNHNKNLSLNY
jgi:hypothetical protein